MQNANTQLTTHLGKSKNDYTALKARYDKLNGDYDRLTADLNEYKSKKAEAPPAPVVVPVADNNSLRLNLYSSKNKDIPDNLVIYLIPDVSANKKIIKDSKAMTKTVILQISIKPRA